MLPDARSSSIQSEKFCMKHLVTSATRGSRRMAVRSLALIMNSSGTTGAEWQLWILQVRKLFLQESRWARKDSRGLQKVTKFGLRQRSNQAKHKFCMESR